MPQLKNLLEKSFTITSFSSEGGEKVEAKDGGAQSGDDRNKKALSTGVKREKGKILDQFIELTGYPRVYARSLLRTVERKIARDQRRHVAVGQAWMKGRKVYDQQVLNVLRQIWVILDYICGKRLAAIMPEVLARLEYFAELKVESEIKAKLLRISAATIDRLLRAERNKQHLRGRARTKPGTLLKQQIPLRTFSE